ncbi:MAG: hypothetical protein IT561_16435 [Alphaproteobacteria bacterium]|nr:hypothetical protein [Alphaproteobacteria bacterium]
MRQPAIQDLVAGQLQAVSAPVGAFTQQADAGRIRFLGVSGATRSGFAPSVPTFAEPGYPDRVLSEWFGCFAPSGTPAAMVERANAALRVALAHQDVVDGIGAMGLEARFSTAAELATLIRQSHDRRGPIVQKIGFTAYS